MASYLDASPLSDFLTEFAMSTAVTDPRPVLDDDAVLGVRCRRCRYPVAQNAVPWCPACYGPVAPARFGS